MEWKGEGLSLWRIRCFLWIGLVALLVLFTTHQSQASWGAYGADTLDVNDYLEASIGDFAHFVLTDHGLWYSDLDHPFAIVENSPQIPAVDIDDLWNDTVLVAFSGGTDEDGLYRFTLSGGLELVAAIPRPRQIAEVTDGIFVGYEGGLTYSSDLATWTDVEPLSGKQFLAMGMHGYHYVVATADNGGELYISEDLGESWTGPLEQHLPFVKLVFGGNVDMWGAIPGEGEQAGLWKSTDSGHTWTHEVETNGLVELRHVYGMVVCGWDGGEGHQQGVQAYFPVSGHFVDMNDGLTVSTINRFSYALVTCASIVACTDQGMFLTCEFPTDESVREPVNIPGTFGLAVHPNPFNSMSTISLDLRSEDYITVSLYDVLGRTVKTFHMGQLRGGQHQLSLNASGLGAGIYFVQVEGTATREVKKVVLLK